MCDSQHRCVDCKGYLHDICGHEYYDEAGNVVESLLFPWRCNSCHESNAETPKKRGASSLANNKASAKRQKKKPAAKKKQTAKKSANAKKKKGASKDDDDEATESEVESSGSNKEEDDSFFTIPEVVRFDPGFIFIDDLKRGETTMDRLKSEYVQSNCRIVDKYVKVSAIYWGGLDYLKKTEWWKEDGHTIALSKLNIDEMEKALLIGKVLGKVRSGGQC